jgi:hypothetical protein
MRQTGVRQPGGEVDVAPFLRLISSDISEISDRGSQIFILKSAQVPDLACTL